MFFFKKKKSVEEDYQKLKDKFFAETSMPVKTYLLERMWILAEGNTRLEDEVESFTNFVH